MSESANDAARAPKPVIEQAAEEAAPATPEAAPAASDGTASGAGSAKSKKKPAAKAKGRARGNGGSGSSQGVGSGSNAGSGSSSSRLQDATAGLFEGLGRAVWTYANDHPHTVLYGTIGFILAVLILVIGIWDTIVIAVFVIVGAVIGQMVDGDNAIVNFFSGLFDGRK